MFDRMGSTLTIRSVPTTRPAWEVDEMAELQVPETIHACYVKSELISLIVNEKSMRDPKQWYIELPNQRTLCIKPKHQKTHQQLLSILYYQKSYVQTMKIAQQYSFLSSEALLISKTTAKCYSWILTTDISSSQINWEKIGTYDRILEAQVRKNRN